MATTPRAQRKIRATQLPDPPPTYAYCEPETAASLAPWHIRPLTAKGLKRGGGIDTPPLCGRTWPGGWDLNVPVTLDEAKTMARSVGQTGFYGACPKCVEAFAKIMED